MGVSFEGRNIYPPEAGKLLPPLVVRPQALNNKAAEEAEKGAASKEGLLWGCALQNFKTTPPCHEMR